MYDLTKGKGLSRVDYADLVTFIAKNHAFTGVCGKGIKHVDARYDFKFQVYYSLTLYGVFLEGEVVFDITKEDAPSNLKDWIYNWLDTDTTEDILICTEDVAEC